MGYWKDGVRYSDPHDIPGGRNESEPKPFKPPVKPSRWIPKYASSLRFVVGMAHLLVSVSVFLLSIVVISNWNAIGLMVVSFGFYSVGIFLLYPFLKEEWGS